jgi:SM-20-related protein
MHMTDFPDTDWRTAVDALAGQGHVVLPGVLPAAVWQPLREEAAALLRASAFSPARIGRGEGTHRQSDIRGDGLCWLEPGRGAGAAYLAWMDGLRRTLNRELFLGLQEFEAHYAHYPVGAFYRRHVDRHRDSNARVVSSVFYLNADWQAHEGGELCMYDAQGRLLFSQVPEGGTLVLFMSDDMPHEVKTAGRERWSIAGWFRTRGAPL